MTTKKNMSWIKNQFLKLSKYFIYLIGFLSIFLIFLQLGSIFFIKIIGYKNISVKEIIEGSDLNNHLNMDDKVSNKDLCKDYISTLQAHPYLAHTHNRCFSLNEFNLLGANLDWNNTKLHRIGVFGGSVAAQFSGENKGESFFQNFLNKCFESKLPNKNEFRVLNFADGAWKHPNQPIALLLYGDYINTAISIEGFNEHYRINNKKDFLNPSQNFKRAILNSSNIRIEIGLLDIIYKRVKDTIFEDLSLTKMLIFSLRELYKLSNIKLEQNNPLIIDLNKIVDYKPQNIKNIDRYKNFVLSFISIANSKKIPNIIILQPVPLYKNLTKTEKIVVKKLDYFKQYEILRLATNISEKFIDMSELFIDENSQIFEDRIHFVKSEKGYGFSKGDKVLSKEITKNLIKLYPDHLKKKKCD
jgi:hypothetical protein